MNKAQFSKQEIKDKLILTLFFKRKDKDSPVLDLYLAGSVRTKFEIKTEEIIDGLPFWKAETDALLCDKVQLVPRKELQALVGKKLTTEEIRPLLKDGADGKVDELINLFHIKLNQIYAKQKLYGREVKNFELV